MIQACDKCGRNLSALFYSVECEWCKYGPGALELYEAYVVVNQETIKANQTDAGFVFASYTGANTYRKLYCYPDDKIYLVKSVQTIMFQYRMDLPYELQDCLIADKLYAIHPSHQFKSTGANIFICYVID